MPTASETKISLLCAELLKASDPQVVRALADELQQTIHEHIENLRRELLKVPAMPAPFHPTWRSELES